MKVRTRSKLVTSCITLLLTIKCCVSQQTTTDPFYILRSRTFRVIIRVKGRDPGRHLTTYDSVDGVKRSPLLFGFPPPHRRKFTAERLEIFDASTSLDAALRKITLRHPWHDVYLTWDKNLNIRGCGGRGDSRNPPCLEPPYLFLEKWHGNTSQIANSCFKLRLMTSRKRNESGQQVAYLHVTRRNWEMKLKTQRSILTQVLADVAWRAWEGVLDHVFANRAEKRRKRAKRFRRCALDLAAIRHRFIKRLQIEPIQREMKQSLRKNKQCLFRNSSFGSSVALINQIPWTEMTSPMKSSLTCHVTLLVRKHLRSNLLELVNSRCIRGKQWGRMTTAQQRLLVDRTLAAGWRRWEGRAHHRLIALAEQHMDDDVTTFCADEMT